MFLCRFRLPDLLFTAGKFCKTGIQFPTLKFFQRAFFLKTLPFCNFSEMFLFFFLPFSFCPKCVLGRALFLTRTRDLRSVFSCSLLLSFPFCKTRFMFPAHFAGRFDLGTVLTNDHGIGRKDDLRRFRKIRTFLSFGNIRTDGFFQTFLRSRRKSHAAGSIPGTKRMIAHGDLAAHQLRIRRVDPKTADQAKRFFRIHRRNGRRRTLPLFQFENWFLRVRLLERRLIRILRFAHDGNSAVFKTAQVQNRLPDGEF